MILRFRSKDGMFRINAEPDTDFLNTLEELVKKINIKDPQSIHISDRPNDKGQPANSFIGKTIDSLGLKNGSMLFLTYNTSDLTDTPSSTSIQVTKPTSISIEPISIPKPLEVKQLPVDDYLDGKDGYIKRNKSSMCRHGDKGMCEYCSPLPPWDKNYKKEQGFKHISYHAHLNEINDQKNNKNNATSYMAPLEEPNYNVNLNCPSGHAPYPKGICSKCQPPVITLQQQQFRMVDHVEFADHSILNKFIDSWRQTGLQRFGILYGRYEAFEKVPLGIKAVVEAIYEPPQANELDGITLLDWENENQVDEIAASLGLYKVGITFTDLIDSGMGNGTVLCKRHKNSYFLSCLEVLMAARYQNKHPNISKHCNSGQYSSKFVTCVISGGLQGEIEPRSYQVSTSAEALVRADIISGSTQPSQLIINQSDGKRYVPDVFYLKINEYGLEVKTNAKPSFPVDFLLVTLLDSFPLDPTPFFQNGFAIENRDFLGELQDLHAVYKHLNNDKGDGSQLCDFHLLVCLAKLNILGEAEYNLILKFVKHRQYEDYLQLVESPGWMTLITILEHSH